MYDVDIKDMSFFCRIYDFYFFPLYNALHVISCVHTSTQMLLSNLERNEVELRNIRKISHSMADETEEISFQFCVCMDGFSFVYARRSKLTMKIIFELWKQPRKDCVLIRQHLSGNL